MFDRLKRILEKVDADYADVRHEVKRTSTVTFNGRELTEISSNSADGYVLRVLKNGGFSSVTFTRERDSDRAVKAARENAKLLASNLNEPVSLAPVDPVVDHYIPELDEDPRKVSMEEKLDIVRTYNEIPLSREQIGTTTLTYQDVTREKHFISSEGAEIREDLVTTRIAGEIIAKDGALAQNVRVRAGGSNGFGSVRGQEEHFEARTKVAIDLLRAKPVQGGVYRCILNQNLAGVFAHEAFGHFSEADIVENLPAMREKMRMGKALGSEVLSITDDATIPGQTGFYKYDDEGVPVRRTPLMKDGVLVGRLHSRRTSMEFDEPLTGHTVAEDYRFPPIVRMGTIFIEPGEPSLDDLLEMLGDGLYILNAKGGQTSGENFTFGAQEAYIVRNGEISDMVRDINISGNLYETLRSIRAVGNDLTLSKVGGCGKGQLNIRSTHGAPHVLVEDVIIGGA
jgi:TldD protein